MSAGGLRLVHLIPSLGGGGAERQLARLAGEQVRRGHRVTVVSFGGGVHEAATRATGSTVLRLTRPHRDPLVLMELRALLRRLRPDVVHTWLYAMDVLGGVAARTLRTPWVLCERCSRECYPDTPRERIRRRVGRGARAVVANSGPGRAYWSDVIGAERCFVAPNALDPLPSSPPERSPDGGRPLVLFAARFEEQKNVLLTVAAFEAVTSVHPGAEFVLCGEGPLRPAAIAAVTNGPLAGRAQLPGYCGELATLLSRAAVFVSLSRFEGQPNAVLEAMAAGCPLVLSDIPAHRELLDQRAAHFVGAGDATGAAVAIVDVLEQPGAAAVRAAAARAVAAGFTPARTGDSYELVYQQVLPCVAS